MKLKALMAEYGGVAVGVYLTIFVLCLGGTASALSMGIALDGVGASLGVWGGAYLATKLMQPLRIGATLLLTPIVARLIRRA
jgi:hypothetical protein